LLVTFEVPNGTSSNLITVWIPRRATAEKAFFTIELGEGVNEQGSGALDFKINLNSILDGSSIPKVRKAIEIRPWFDIVTPRLIEPGTCSTRFTELRIRFLPTVRSVGYFVSKDSRVILLTQRLSRITNSNLGEGEKICLASRTPMNLTMSGVNRVTLANRTSSPYLAVDLADKFAGKSIQVQVRRIITGTLETFTIATARANVTGDAIIRLTDQLYSSDKLRVRVGKLLVPIRTVTLMNP
jgi:hypothetical protein